MSLIRRLARELVKPLATLLVRSTCGPVAGTMAGGLLNIVEQVTKDYLDQQELVRQFERISEKIVQHLLPSFQQAVDEGGVDVDKVIATIAWVLNREVSAEALLEFNMRPDYLAAAWTERHPDRWNDFNSDERALHEEALADTARYVVQIAPELPGFRGRFAGRVVQHLQSVTEDLDNILGRVDDIHRMVSDSVLDDDRARFEGDYRLAVFRRFDYMELLGADIRREARRHPLSIAYVSLSLMEAEGTLDDVGMSRPFEAILDCLTARRLLVRGEAGSGKSTLFRWAALQTANPPEDQDTAGWRGCIPFLIHLRDCPQGRLPSLVQLPAEVAKNVGAPPEKWVREVFDMGRAMVLFDGVDEVPNDRRDDVRQEIETIIQAYPANFYLVSTRPAAVPEDWLAGADFQVAAINPMTAADRAQFIRKWHEAVRDQLRRNKQTTDENFATLAEALTRKLYDQPTLAHLATNPLLCGMICALNLERREQLPDTQVELCEDLCKMLLHRREKESDLDEITLSPTYGKLNYKQKRAVVQELAHYMVRNGQSSVTSEEADRAFGEALRRFPGNLADNIAEIRQGFLERSGLLRQPQPDRIDFVHNTLKEYLAGDRFAHLGDTGPLVEHSLDPAWQPSILFAAGSEIVGFADRLIERLLDDRGMVRRMSKLVGRGTDVERARKVFAVRCGGTALHLSAENREQLNEILRQTSRPSTPSESEAFAALGEFIVPFLRHETSLSARTAVASIRTLHLIDSEAARECLHSYAADRRKSVHAEYLAATDVVSLSGTRMRLIPAGEFLMGSNEREAEQPVHQVELTKDFLLAAFPVTQEEYERVMDGANPSRFKGDPRRPVERVAWLDAIRFCNRLSEIEERTPYYRVTGERVEIQGGDGFRLPTEAEWEYCCRAGSTGRWCFGDDERELTQFAWYVENSKNKTHPVGFKEPNAWGLYDMHGNVWEWCADWYGDYKEERVVDPRGPDNASSRVFRGGSWDYSAVGCRSAYRSRFGPGYRHYNLGFRVAAVPPSQAGQGAEPGT